MDRRASNILQQLATLPPDIYAKVTEVIMKEFLVPQPSIMRTLESVAPHRQKPAKRQRRTGTPRQGYGLSESIQPEQPASRAGMLRELLMKEGPKTAAEIAQRVDIPATQIHPTLASIGAKPVGTTQDADGDERKLYGLPGAMVRDESSGP